MGSRGLAAPENDSDETLQVRHQRLRLEQRLFGHDARVKVGRYTLDEWLGSGGMGAVYAARDPSLDRRIAIKVLHRRLSDSPHANARLVREAKAMARLSNAHVVTVHEVGLEHGQPYIAMELMLGGTLADWARRHPGDEAGRTDRLLTFLRECAEGLIAAHDAGLVHRDFKPENVLLTDDGVAKVADFGLVRLPGEGPETGTVDDDDFAALDDGRTLTGGGSTPGTPRYMAPEQQAGIADERSDQYALCKTFLEVLGDGPRPAAIDAILQQGSALDPGQRFDGMRDLLRALDAASPRHHRRTTLATVAVASSLLAGAVAWYARDSPSQAVIPCETGQEQLDAAWGEPRQHEIRTAFAESGSDSWRNAWDGVQTRFDAYTEAWAAARLDACEATRIRRVQDEGMMAMRLACLDQRRAALEMLADAYAAADRAVVDDALTTSHALPSIAACADREELVFGDGGLTLEDPRVRAAYDALGRADALRNLGRQAEARASYAALAPELEALGAKGLLSACLRSQAKMALVAGDYEEASRLARAALDQAELADRLRDEVLAWLAMSQIARLRGRPDDGELYLERAETLAARRPEARGLQAEVAIVRGSYESDQGTPEAAVAALDHAVELAREVGGSPLAILEARVNTLGALSRLGRDDEVLRRGADLMREARELLGPRHVLTLTIAGARAQFFIRRSDWSTAAELTRPSLDLAMHEHRADLVADLRIGYATAQQGLQHFDEAQQVLEQLIEEATPVLGREHSQVLTARLQIAALHIDAKRYHAAITQLDQIADFVGTEIDAGGSAIHPMNRCGYWSNMALARSGAKQHPEAVEAADLALAICRKVAAARSVWMFTSLRYAGEVYEQANHTTRALACYEEARSIADEITVSPDELAFVDAGLARLRS